MTQKILLIALAFAFTTGCSQQKRWDDQQKHQLRKEIREYRDQGYLSNVPESDFVILCDSVTEIIANNYPNYDAFKSTPGSNDTLSVVMIEVLSDRIAADHKYMRYLFPYMSLVANAILPLNLSPVQIDEYYKCLANKVNQNFTSMQDFMAAIGSSNKSDSLTRVLLSQCATESIAAVAKEEKAAK